MILSSFLSSSYRKREFQYIYQVGLIAFTLSFQLVNNHPLPYIFFSQCINSPQQEPFSSTVVKIITYREFLKCLRYVPTVSHGPSWFTRARCQQLHCLYMQGTKNVLHPTSEFSLPTGWWLVQLQISLIKLSFSGILGINYLRLGSSGKILKLRSVGKG